ncbi:MAG: iron-sulfur cluster insertion protein ErpA [Chloroflexi bacterium]|nr:iron-sulfur cluster insertion protein ErpA [Chloroflexota bacterium]
MTAPADNLTFISDEVETPTVTLTNGAAAKVRSILAERNAPNHSLRVFVSGGGCSGMQYGMALEGQPREFDTVIEQDGVKVVIDPTSMMYLGGATIDYVDNIMGGGFRIDNPNAVSTCGCGHSFRTSGGAAPASSGGGCACGH